MKSVSINHSEADDQYKAAAALDAQVRNSCNKSLYSSLQIRDGIKLKDALSDLYSSDQVFLNYRQGFISVKVAKPAVIRDRKLLRSMEDGWAKAGYTKHDTPQGFIYRIPRKQ